MKTLNFTLKEQKVSCTSFFRRKRSIFFPAMVFAILFAGNPCRAQQADPSLPILTASSPKASMINRYGEYPVSLYTGLVDITIPIFEININGIKVPIEFKYHASGIKFDDLPLELGYGWTLIAGGIVSRSVRGTPEGHSISGSGQRADPFCWIKEIGQIERYQNINSTATNNDQKKPLHIQNGVRYPFNSNSYYDSYYSDSEYDVYSYNFLNHTGQLYRLDGSSVAVPTNGLYTFIRLGNNLHVTDKDGISYIFTEMEYDFYNLNNVWYLTKIISANNADTLVFNYTSFANTNYGSKPVIDQRFELKTIYNYQGSSFLMNELNTTGGKTYKNNTAPRLNYIQYRGGKIEFVYTNATTSRKLSEIKISDHTNTLFRIVKLNKPQIGDWIDGIEFRDKANTVQQTYSFEYESRSLFTTTGGMDYWGYYNGATVGMNGTNYIPDFTIQYFSNWSTVSYKIPGTNRIPNFDFMKRGVLNKIVYPSKGYTIFEYEAHQSNNQIYGGLRIKEIRNYNHDGTLAEKKWYKYGEGESGNGRAAHPVSYTNPDLSFFYREFKLIENGGTAAGGAAPVYQRNHFKYFYPFPLTSYFTAGSSVVYPEVTEYSGTGSVSNGKTVYQYTDTPDESNYPTFRGQRPPQRYRTYEWKNGSLLSRKVYNSSGQLI